ncbi:uncharacterized protein LOC18017914 [Eutrema salsugineum]|uniref:uncharacterized protein LOC18017914 n=1 Tax=Eutrema salsugineum TaxID=72664 RepID=UPI000CECF5DD|nr:uncharacterized protein LOC18017914 [Eutrema salsugineum]
MATKPNYATTEDDADFAPTKKQKIDDEGDSDSSSDDSFISVGDMGTEEEWRAYRYYSKEPEWDVDSFDGREFIINPRIRKLYETQELYDEYYRKRLQAFESKGFIPDHSNGIYEVYLEDPVRIEHLTELVNVCVKKFNETKGKTLELVNILRATERGYGNVKFYITFMAREYQNGPLVEYQAKAIKFGNNRPPFPILCRPSPKPET